MGQRRPFNEGRCLVQCRNEMISASRLDPFVAEIITGWGIDLKKIGNYHIGVGLNRWLAMEATITAVQAAITVVHTMQRAMC